MKKFLILFISICLPAIYSYAGDVRGKVVDPRGAALCYATVALYQSDSTLVRGGMTEQDGTFSLKASEGEYRLEVSMIGFKTYSANVKVSEKGETDLAAITLEEDAQALTAALVTERIPVIEQKIDKIVMNVAEAVSTQGSTAKDILRKAPGVAIDKDGNVTLNGQSVEVWIDGRPSHLSGRELTMLLASTDGTSIDKIEIMAHPSSKYDAAGGGGIIDIKTKKNFLQGFNGSINASYGGMGFSLPDFDPFYNDNYQLGASLSYRTEKVSTNFRYSSYNMNESSLSQSQTTLPGVSQNSSSLFGQSYKMQNLRLSTDWFIDSKNIVGAVLSYRPNSFSNWTTPANSFTDTYINDVHAYRQTSETLTEQPSGSFQANLNYTHTFDQAKSQEMTINIDYNRHKSNSTTFQSSPWTVMDGVSPQLDSSIFKGEGNRLINTFAAKADYQQVVLGCGMLEAGAKFSSAMTDNLSIFQDKMAGAWTPSPSKSADFNYREDIAAAYGSLAVMFSPQWSMKAGLRAEATFTHGDWRSAGSQSDTSYVNLFPTFYVGYTPNQKLRYSFSYTYRIQRPSYNQLDPSVLYSDATTYNTGNPYLQPSYTHQGVLGFGLGSHLNVSLLAGYDVNHIQQVISNPQGVEKQITFDNFGTQLIAGANFSISELPIFKWWLLSVNFLDAYLKNSSSDSTLEVGKNFFNGFASFTFLLPKDWSIEAGGFIMSPVNMGYMTIDKPLGQCWGGVKKTMLDGKMNIALNCEDIFNSMNMYVSSFDTNGNKIFSMQNYSCSRKITLSLFWRFGRNKTPERYRKVGEADERLGGGRSSGVSVPTM